VIKKYLLYLLRWQLSTPILAIVLILLVRLNTILATVIANLIGGLIFFWVDKFIFRVSSKVPLWEIRDNTACHVCGNVGKSYRIVEWRGYNRRLSKDPQFRCEKCKDEKMSEIAKALDKGGKEPQT